MSKKERMADREISYEDFENGNSEKKKPTVIKRIFTYFFRMLLILMETVLLVGMTLYAVMFILAKGPSPTARNLFVMSVRETSAIGFLANIYLTDEEIAEIEAGKNSDEYVETDTSLININKEKPEDTESSAGPKTDEWGLIDEDGDGIIVEPIKGGVYSGYMMVVLDPSRVIMGCMPEYFGIRGFTVAEMVEEFDAVAGINAGGFYDPDGQGNGSIPDSVVVVDGELHYAELGCANGMAGFDENHILHVGRMTNAEIKANNIKSGVCFGPALVVNGEPVDSSSLPSGLNPRTAIGQRSDGAVLMLVIDGRQVISAGATYENLVDIMLEYGAVNATNLDGGSSTLMWYEGGYINNCASVVGIRPVPTTFLVLKEGANTNG